MVHIFFFLILLNKFYNLHLKLYFYKNLNIWKALIIMWFDPNLATVCQYSLALCQQILKVSKTGRKLSRLSSWQPCLLFSYYRFPHQVWLQTLVSDQMTFLTLLLDKKLSTWPMMRFDRLHSIWAKSFSKILSLGWEMYHACWEPLQHGHWTVSEHFTH